MQIQVLGSGSKGNCYIISNETEALIIDAGLPFKEVKIALDFDVKKIVGVLISHCHNDHNRYSHQYERAGIRVVKPFGNEKDKSGVLGNFLFNTFSCVHDADCYGFLIWHPDVGKILYATDTELIKYRFSNLRTIMVEANYDTSKVDLDNMQKTDHVRLGHMEIGTTVDFLRENNNLALKEVLLLHLSSISADSDDFKRRAEEVVGCKVEIAKRGLILRLES